MVDYYIYKIFNLSSILGCYGCLGKTAMMKVGKPRSFLESYWQFTFLLVVYVNVFFMVSSKNLITFKCFIKTHCQFYKQKWYSIHLLDIDLFALPKCFRRHFQLSCFVAFCFSLFGSFPYLRVKGRLSGSRDCWWRC